MLSSLSYLAYPENPVASKAYWESVKNVIAESVRKGGRNVFDTLPKILWRWCHGHTCKMGYKMLAGSAKEMLVNAEMVFQIQLTFTKNAIS